MNQTPFAPAGGMIAVLLLVTGCENNQPRTNDFAVTPVSRSTLKEDDNLKKLEPIPAESIQPSRAIKPAVSDPMRKQCESEIAAHREYPFDFSLRSLAGRTLRKDAYRGRLLIVDIWATWCGPCVREVPHFIALQEKYSDAGLAIIGINYERGGSANESLRSVDSFARAVGINYPLAMGNQSITDQIPSFRGYPTTLFIDGRGKVRLTLRGARSHRELETFVQILLADDSINPVEFAATQTELKPGVVQQNPFLARD